MIKTIDLDKKPNLVAKEVGDDRITKNRIKMHSDGKADYRFDWESIFSLCHYCGAPTYITEFVSEFGYVGLNICPDCMRMIADKLEKTIKDMS